MSSARAYSARTRSVTSSQVEEPARGNAGCAGALGVVHQRPERAGEGSRVPHRDEEPGLAVPQLGREDGSALATIGAPAAIASRQTSGRPSAGQGRGLVCDGGSTAATALQSAR